MRKTYRKITGETSDKEVKERHSNIYLIGRALFELVEYFGKSLRKKEKVYHGLNVTVFFHEFTGHFNAPTSTTKDKIIGMFLSFICILRPN